MARHPIRTGVTYVLQYDIRPTSHNATRNRHWSQTAPAIKDVRDTFHVLALAAKMPKAASIRVRVRTTFKGGILPDGGSCYEWEKAAIDGLVDAQVVPDDRGHQVHHAGFDQPAYGDRNSFALVIDIIN